MQQMNCPIILQYEACVPYSKRSSTCNATELSPSDLIHLSNDCDQLQFRICQPDDTATTSNFDEQNEKCSVALNFHRNRNLLGDKLSFKSCSHSEAVSSDNEHNSLSVCPSAISGIIRLGGKAYHLNYLKHTETFVLSPVEPISALHSCDGLYRSIESIRRRWRRSDGLRQDEGQISLSLPDYYRRYLDGIRRYVELVFIADNSIYLKYEKDAAKIHDRLQSIAGIVNSLYAPLNIRVTLVWADIWMSADAVEVNSQADRTLARFVAYRKSQLLAEHPHDNAHLITDVRFGEVIGKAYRGTMCSYDYSGGVIVDHSPNIAFVGGTVAHEMGHNFGMDHDSGYPDPCACAAQQCIMAPASSNINASTYFSDCSLDALNAAFKRGVDYCLRNVPEVAFGDAKCGNGVLEAGEECDCGSTKLCPNSCCIAATCKLAKDAECADGDCCDVQTCKPKSMAKICRNATNSCDLPEYCDGRNPVCPPDFFVQNGLECPDDPEGFCFDGHCGSRTQQCRLIWGPTGDNSVGQCYAYNRDGTFSGNCGYDPHKNRYLPCLDEDIQCGRLQCRHSAERPTFGDPSAVFSAYNYVRLSDGSEAACRSVRTTYTGSGGRSGKMRDPGMVPDGAKCGVGKICVDAKCRNYTEVTQMVTACEPLDCNGKGVCNNVGNCHCVPGYGGPGCNIPGFGGSLNSGPATDQMFNPGLILVYLLFIGLIAFAFATYYCKRHKDYWLHKKIWKIVRRKLKIESNVRVPVRRAPPVPGVSIQHPHRFSFSALWGDSPTKNPVVPVPQASVAAHYSAPITGQVVSRPLMPTNSTAALLTAGNASYPSASWASNPQVYLSVGLSQSEYVQPSGAEVDSRPIELKSAISPSTSSSSNETYEISERRPLKPPPKNVVSNRKLMEEIKRSIEQPTNIHSSQSSRALENQKPVFAQYAKSNIGSVSTSSVDQKASAPPPPPHRNRLAAGAQPPPTPKKPEKPQTKGIVEPKSEHGGNGSVATRLAQLEANISSKEKKSKPVDEEKPLSVRQLTAKFNTPK